MNDDVNSIRERRLAEAIALLPRQIQPPVGAWETIGGRIRGAPLARGVTSRSDPLVRRRIVTFAAAAVVLITVLAIRESWKNATPASPGVPALAVSPTIAASKALVAPTNRVAVHLPNALRTTRSNEPSFDQAPQSATTLARFEARRTEAVPTPATQPTQPVRVSLESTADNAPLPVTDIVPIGRAVVLRPSNPNITVIWFY
jgi:hypothetical protein